MSERRNYVGLTKTHIMGAVKEEDAELLKPGDELNALSVTCYC